MKHSSQYTPPLETFTCYQESSGSLIVMESPMRRKQNNDEGCDPESIIGVGFGEWRAGFKNWKGINVPYWYS